MLEFTCPTCGKRVQGADALAGLRVLCPGCDSTIALPPAAPTASVAAPEHAAQAKIAMPGAASAFCEGEPPLLPRDNGVSIRKELPRVVFGWTPLVVAVAIVATLIALLIPAVQKSREVSARSQSMDNLKGLTLSFHNHYDTLKAIPYNGVGPAVASTPWTGSWAFQILPYIEQGPRFAQPQLLRVPNIGAHLLMCPGRSRSPASSTGMWSDYAINTWLNDPLAGAFDAPNAKLTMKDITDGTSNTIFIGHATVDLPYGVDVTPQSGLIVIGGASGTARNLGINVSDWNSANTGQLSWGGPFSQGSLMGMADGTIRLFDFRTFADLMPLLTPAGNERVMPPE